MAADAHGDVRSQRMPCERSGRPLRGESAMSSRSHWGIILAGGDGTRLRSLTRRIAGDERPKQFCRLLGDKTLLEQTRQRAMRLLSPQRTFTVVVRCHEGFYAPLLGDVPSERMVIQPENRGTAPAILYGLLRLRAIAPRGSVAIFPSDHYISDDEAFMAHVDRAFELVRARPDMLVLLGVIPDGAEVGYGWIEPGERVAELPWPDAYRVRRFWEKPTPALAQTLLATGCLWNSFVMVGDVATLLALIRSAAPGLFDSFGPVLSRLTTPWEDASVRRLYSWLQSTDFSRQVLAVRPASLSVLALKGVAWSDLGEPCRVMATLAGIGERPEWAAESSASSGRDASMRWVDSRRC